MATQQAWDDFSAVKSQVTYIEGELSVCIKDAVHKLQVLVEAIVADQARAAAVAALADQHPTHTTAYLLDKYAKILAVRDALVGQGF